MTTAQIGDLSTLFVWGALVSLTIALIAFAADLAHRTDVRAEHRSAAKRPARDLVGAAVVTDSATSADVSDAARSAADAAVDQTVRRRAAGIAQSTSWLGVLLLLAGIVTRGIAAGRTPWANMYEFTLVGSFVAVAVFLVVGRFRDVQFLGAFVTGIAAIFLTLGLNVFYVAAMGVQPALQSYWLKLHVGVAILATGVFTVAFTVSALQLLRTARDNGSARLGSWYWLDRASTPANLEALSFRLNAVGFVLWTFTIIGGAIWAEHAWGRYWGWDPKEVWSFVVWVVYAAYLHARTTRGWAGTRAAWFVVVGFACLLFNFTGVNYLFSELHGYADV